MRGHHVPRELDLGIFSPYVGAFHIARVASWQRSACAGLQAALWCWWALLCNRQAILKHFGRIGRSLPPFMLWQDPERPQDLQRLTAALPGGLSLGTPSTYVPAIKTIWAAQGSTCTLSRPASTAAGLRLSSWRFLMISVASAATAVTSTAIGTTIATMSHAGVRD